MALWLGNQLGKDLQTILGVFLVLTIGVLHGTNDLQIIDKSFVKSQKTNRIKFFYLLLVNINILFFYYFSSNPQPEVTNLAGKIFFVLSRFVQLTYF